MAYMNHISNLYDPRAQTILLFKECWATEKVHGTSGKLLIQNDPQTQEVKVQYFSGGASFESFTKLFNEENLKKVFKEVAFTPETIFEIYGEIAGGKMQKMSATYGPDLFFIAFGVHVNQNRWLNIPDAEALCNKFGIEFVPYTKVTTDIESLDKAKLAPSQLAIRKGMGDNKIMEGVVLYPIIEMTTNNGARIIAKHKRDEFRETASPKKVIDPEKIKILQDAEKIASEYVVLERLKHVLDRIVSPDINKMGEIIQTMLEDVSREGSFEIKMNDYVRKEISRRTALLYKEYLKNLIK